MISAVAVGLAGAPGLADPATSVVVRTGFLKSHSVEGKDAQIGRLHRQVAVMNRTLDRNPKHLSADGVKSLKIRLGAFERAGRRAIEAGVGELKFWTPTSDVPQYGCVLDLGGGAARRYRSISIASSADSTAVTEANTGSGRKTLDKNQLVVNETWYHGGVRKNQTALWTFSSYPGGGVTHGSYQPRKGTQGTQAAATEDTAAARPYYGSTLKITPNKKVVVRHYRQPRAPTGKFAPGRELLSSKDTASKEGLVGSWSSAQKAASAAARGINAILKQGEGATVSWEVFDQKVGAILTAINRAQDSVRDGGEIFVAAGGKARPARMSGLVSQGNLALTTLGRARSQVDRIYESVHERLGFISASKLSRVLGDVSAPLPQQQGKVPAWAIEALGKAAQNLAVAERQIGQGANILSRSL